MMRVLFLSERSAALLEVCLISILAIFILWISEAYLGWFKFWAWIAKALLVPAFLLAIVLPRRSLRSYGLLPRNPRFSFKWSSVFVAAFVLPAAVSIMLSVPLGAAGQAELSPSSIALNVIWYIAFVGLIEEAYFRGYMQSRLNEVFEKRWRKLVFKAWRVNYGAGLLLTSAIFALVHIVNYWNPLVPRWELPWWTPMHLLYCFFFGCVAGALREASGDIYVPASLHGGIMIAAFLLAYTNMLILNISLFISWFIFFFLLAFFFHEFENLKIGVVDQYF